MLPKAMSTSDHATKVCAKNTETVLDVDFLYHSLYSNDNNRNAPTSFADEVIALSSASNSISYEKSQNGGDTSSRRLKRSASLPSY